MIFRVPNYYRDFKCTADKCSDNCCIGWEIDIDSETMKKYDSVTGEFKNKMQSGISTSGTPHFILDKDERCPFLNDKNLCEIFINLGESCLCQICTDHPRYYEWFGDIKEGGVGICCEEAAKLILTDDKPFSYYETDIPDEDSDGCDEEFFEYLQCMREKIITHLNNKSLPLKKRLHNILVYANAMQGRYDDFDFTVYDISEAVNENTTADSTKEMISFFADSLEFMGGENLFKPLCDNYTAVKAESEKFLLEYPQVYDYLENLAVYFIWRHFLKGVFEEEFYSKAAFAVISTVMCGLLFMNSFSFDEQTAVRMSVYYSKQVEYSEENLERLYDAFYDNAYFSLEKMLNLLEIL